MDEFLAFAGITGALLLGILTLVFYMMNRAEARELNKDPLRPPVVVRFRPKAFLWLVAAIAGGALYLFLAVTMYPVWNVPSYAVGLILVVLIGAIRPIYAAKVGQPFTVAPAGATGEAPDGLPLPAPAGSAPIQQQYPGYYAAPAGTDAFGNPLSAPPAPSAPVQYPGFHTPSESTSDGDGGPSRTS